MEPGPVIGLTRRRLPLLGVALMLMPLCATLSARPATTFASRMADAMDRMMAGMAVKPTGDPDQDFVAMMVPHHQGAIDMAVTELRYGHDEQLKRIAQEIIVDQQQEIAAMRLALGQPLPPSDAAPTQADTPKHLNQTEH